MLEDFSADLSNGSPLFSPSGWPTPPFASWRYTTVYILAGLLPLLPAQRLVTYLEIEQTQLHSSAEVVSVVIKIRTRTVISAINLTRLCTIKFHGIVDDLITCVGYL
jgi:hypothetical protein